MNKTRINIEEDDRKRIVAILNQVLADVTDLQSQLRYAHWNVRGALFYPMHKLFEELGEPLDELMDDLAERITALGGVALGTIRQAVSGSSLKEFNVDSNDDLSFLNELTEKTAQLANKIREDIDKTAELGDANSSDLLTGLGRVLDKSLWLMEAHIRS